LGGRDDHHTDRVARRAGLAKKISPHTLRRAFITAALDAGVPLRDVQEAASHADPRTTMRYDNSWKLHQMGEPRTSFRQLMVCSQRPRREYSASWRVGSNI
jgi:integrase